MAWLGNFIRNLSGSDTSPDKVLEVKTDKYDKKPIISREESLFLYSVVEGNETKYEIVMHKPCSESLSLGYSIFRSKDKNEAVRKFQIFKDKLPLLCDVSNANLALIQKYCITILENSTWNIAHLTVFFNLVDSLKHPKIFIYVNSLESSSGLSPLHLAIKEGNLNAINNLMHLGADLSQLDHSGNTIYHYAAETNKDVVLALNSAEENLKGLIEPGGKGHEPPKGLNQRNISGHTPLHIACMKDKPECVRALISIGANVNSSATSTSTGVKSTAGFMGDLIDAKQKNVSTEFYRACEMDLHSLLEKLQASEAVVTNLHSQLTNLNSLTLNDATNGIDVIEMKNGGTPLHWSVSKEVINALLDRNCDINALNFSSRSALQVMVTKKRLECIVALLAREADPNICDQDGNTALHLAVKENEINIIQALVVFGCDINIVNNQGETARHVAACLNNQKGGEMVYTLHAVGAKRCSSVSETCTAQCSPGGKDDGIPPPLASGPDPRIVSEILQTECLALGQPKRGGRLLCLDGGGIRGLVLVVLLLHLEEAIGKPIIHCFDWLAATSTGGILALALSAGKTLKECLCLYFYMKEHAFSGFRPYSSEPLEVILKETLGTDTTMKDIEHPKLMITGCLADRKPVDLHFFRNYPSSPEILSGLTVSGPITGPKFKPFTPYDEQLLWEVARATGAAPSYFRAFDRYIDGGLIANNPTLDALTEIHEYNTALGAVGRDSEIVDLSVVVSVGTGSVPLTEVGSMDVFWPSGIWDTAKAYSGVRSLQAVLVDQATQADGRVVDRTRALCSMLRLPYFRFSPQLSEDIAMDEKTDAKLVNMLWETKACIVSQPDVVKRLVQLLNC